MTVEEGVRTGIVVGVGVRTGLRSFSSLPAKAKSQGACVGAKSYGWPWR